LTNIGSTCQGNCNTTWKGVGGSSSQGSHSPVPLLGPPIYVWCCQGLLKKRQKAYCVEELRRTKIERPMQFQTKTRFFWGPQGKGCWGGARANHKLSQQARGHPFFYSSRLVCKPILQAKWSNKQKTKVLCINVHFVHFYPSIIFKIQMCPTLNKGGVLCMGAVRGGGRGGFIFLSANRRAQGALLLFLLNYRETRKNFISIFPVSECVPMMFPLSS
jgi:hypothetical protein